MSISNISGSLIGNYQTSISLTESQLNIPEVRHEGIDIMVNDDQEGLLLDINSWTENDENASEEYKYNNILSLNISESERESFIKYLKQVVQSLERNRPWINKNSS